MILKKNITVIIPKKYEIGWIVEILNYLKINFLVLEETKSYQFKKIYIPNYPAPSGNFHKENILKLEKHLLKHYQKIFTVVAQLEKFG